MSKYHQAKQQSFYNISYTKPYKANLMEKLKNDVKMPSSQTAKFLQHSLHKASEGKPHKETQNDGKMPSSQTAKFLQHLLHKALEGKTSQRNSERF